MSFPVQRLMALRPWPSYPWESRALLAPGWGGLEAHLGQGLWSSQQQESWGGGCEVGCVTLSLSGSAWGRGWAKHRSWATGLSSLLVIMSNLDGHGPGAVLRAVHMTSFIPQLLKGGPGCPRLAGKPYEVKQPVPRPSAGPWRSGAGTGLLKSGAVFRSVRKSHRLQASFSASVPPFSCQQVSGPTEDFLAQGTRWVRGGCRY